MPPVHRQRSRRKHEARVPALCTPERPNWEVASWFGLILAAAVALFLRHRADFFFSWTDEQIYLYVARRVAEGAVLYRDIDSSRTPLVILPIAWLIRANVSPLLAGRSVAFSAELATAGLLFWGGYRLFSWRVGALGALLLLTSPEVFERVHYTGIQLVSAMTLACVLLLLRGHFLRAGMLSGLSLGAGQHGAAICLTAAVLVFAHQPRKSLWFLLGAVPIVAIVFGGVWFAGGTHLWQSLIGHHLYHLRGPRGGDEVFWELARPWFFEHAYIIVPAALATIVRLSADAVGGSVAGLRPVRVLLSAVAVHIAVVLAIAGARFLYVVVAFPLLVLLAAVCVDQAVKQWRTFVTSSPAGRRSTVRYVFTGVAAAIVLTIGGWAVARSSREKLYGRSYALWPQILHGQVAACQQLDIGQDVPSSSLLGKSATIFGDPTSASALALAGGFRVSADLVDIDPQWILAGSVTRDSVISRVENDHVALVITPPWFLVQDAFFRSYLTACYEPPAVLYPPETGPGACLPELWVFAHRQPSVPCRPSP